MKTRELLENYKSLTIKMLQKVKSDEEFSISLKERENIVSRLNEENIEKKQIGNLIEELEIKKYDEELEECIKKSMSEIKKDIVKVRKSKEAYLRYGNFSSNSVIFSTKR